MEYTLPYFGIIKLNDLKENYYTSANGVHNPISIELCFENKSISQEMADGLHTFLQNIDKLDQHNKANIKKDFEERESETSNYINFYLTEFDETELSDIIGENQGNTAIEKHLLNKLELTRIGLYPDGKYGATYYAMFDYTIYLDGLPCDQLLVVFTDQQGSLDNIGWDS